MKKPTPPLWIAVTPGDPDGIGPEVVWKTIRSGAYDSKRVQLLCVGARKPFERLGARVEEVSLAAVLAGRLPKASSRPVVHLIAAPASAPKRSQFLAGYQAGWSIETATKLVLGGIASALTTGPISKERMMRGGYRYPGHTEFLAHLCRDSKVTPQVTMMLANDLLRVSLVTTHLALKDVSRHLTRKLLRRAVSQTIDHLHSWWGIQRPRVAIAALNPHAGESGHFGREEIQVIAPELKALSKKYGRRCEIMGPMPADTLFAKHLESERYDAVVCMYHDQGLIPVKLLDFPRTVNITLGLPIVRTSVDHGTGFDIAGKNRADPTSFQSAVRLAAQIAHRRTP